jgi:rhodanese-related sulfurtransferase
MPGRANANAVGENTKQCDKPAWPTSRMTRLATAIAVALALLSSCTHNDRMVVGSQCREGNEVGTVVDAPAPTNLDGLKNVHRFASGIYGGSAPATDEAFAILTRLGDAGEGIATIVSVDGGGPDLARASAHNMRYVHIPIGYDGIEPDALAQLAAVMRDLPRPIYVHCHHGRHRGPAAAAAGLIAIGEIQPDEGIALMRIAGTSDAYPALFRDVARTSKLSDTQVTAAGCQLVERRTVTGLVATMVEINIAFDRLNLTRQAHWSTPAEHPDLAPAAEAGIIRDLLANLAKTPDMRDQPAAFHESLAQSVLAADQLETGLLAGLDQTAQTEAHEQNYQRLKQTCTDCHLQYRNR